MEAVAVSGLRHEVVRARRRVRRVRDPVAWAANITTEGDDALRGGYADDCRDEKMAGRKPLDRDILDHLHRLMESPAAKLAQACPGIQLRIERQRRLVFGESKPVCKRGIFLLQPATVRKQHATKLAGPVRAVDRLAVSAVDQAWEECAAIKVRVSQDDGVNVFRIVGWPRPVAQTELFVALEQPAIDQDPASSALQQMLRAGDGAGGAEKGESHRS